MLLLFSIFGLFAQAAPKPIIVVIPFDVKGVPEEEADVLFEVFQSEFANTGKAKIVDRSSLEKIKKQQEFQNSDWSNTDKVAEMGKALNASMVVTGQIMMFKSNLVTTIKLIDVNTTEILSSVVEKTNSTEDLFGRLPDMANKLSKKLGLAGIGKRYEIGDECPGGGIIFYVDEDGFDVYDGKGEVQTCHYLEMTEFPIGNAYWAPKGQDYKEGDYNRNTLGYGKSNTYGIVQAYKGKSLTVNNCAAYAAYTYKNEKTKEGDWFLPSEDELRLLEQKLPERLKVADGGKRYWHSSKSAFLYNYRCTNGEYKSIPLKIKYDSKKSDYIYYKTDWNPYSNKWENDYYTYEETKYYLVRPIRAF